MSLVFLYKDDLVADRMCILKEPCAADQVVMVDKLFLAEDKTFAFGSIGPTLSDKEKGIMGALIKEALIGMKPEHTITHLRDDKWCDGRDGIYLVVMTRKDSFFITKSEGSGRWYLQRVEPTYPLGGGTGIVLANMALLEGVKAEDVTPMVADIIYTVSPEFDHIHRSQLVEIPDVQ